MNLPRRAMGPLDVPVLALGTANWGTRLGRVSSRRIADAALEAGVTFLDTAEGYPAPMTVASHGISERLIGRWLKNKSRQEVLISSKIYGPSRVLRGGAPSRLTTLEIEAAIEGSLRRLGTDYIDLYLIHWPDGADYDRFLGGGALERQAAQAGAMGRAIRDGKIRTWGLSNASRESFDDYIAAANRAGAPPPVVVQNRFSGNADPHEVVVRPVPLMAYGCLDHGRLPDAHVAAALTTTLALPFVVTCCVGCSSERQIHELAQGIANLESHA